MKRIYLTAIALTLGILAGMAQVNAFFDKYADSDQVTSVLITKAMLSMMPESGMKSGNMEIGKIAGKIDNIRILTCEQPRMIAKLKKDLSSISTKGYEELLKVNDNGERTVIYLNSGANGSNSYLIINEEKNEFNAILINGRISPADIRGMVSK